MANGVHMCNINSVRVFGSKRTGVAPDMMAGKFETFMYIGKE